MVDGFGLRPYRNMQGATPNFMVNGAYTIAYNYSSSIGEGDLVIPASTGTLTLASNSPSNPVLGVFMGCYYPNPQNTIQPQNQRAWTAPTLASNVTVSAQYVDDQQVVFAVVASAALSQTSLGLNANFVSNGAPNASTGISTLMLDAASLSTNPSLPLRLVEFQPIYGNGPSAAQPIMGVTLNTAFTRATTGI